jgi:4-azaleucine resistance transporter AzlC
MTTRDQGSNLSGVSAGLTRAVPLILGYVPIGLTYGVLAQKAGLSGLNAVLMSLLVYAGSSQLVAAGLFGSGASAPSIILTTFVVNLRHMLLSAAVAPYLKRWRRGELAAFAYELTDETFALHAASFPSGVPPKGEVFAINAAAQASWLLGTGLGVALGEVIRDVEPLGLDYVLPAMFIALSVMQMEDMKHVGVALFSGTLSVALLLLGAGQWNVILATVIGASTGVLLELWTNNRSS